MQWSGASGPFTGQTPALQKRRSADAPATFPTPPHKTLMDLNVLCSAVYDDSCIQNVHTVHMSPAQQHDKTFASRANIPHSLNPTCLSESY